METQEMLYDSVCLCLFLVFFFRAKQGRQLSWQGLWDVRQDVRWSSSILVCLRSCNVSSFVELTSCGGYRRHVYSGNEFALSVINRCHLLCFQFTRFFKATFLLRKFCHNLFALMSLQNYIAALFNIMNVNGDQRLSSSKKHLWSVIKVVHIRAERLGKNWTVIFKMW